MALIIASGRMTDGDGSLAESTKVLARARKKNLQIITLEIVNLARRWDDKLSPHEFKSGASAMAAIEKAKKLLKTKSVDLVVIKGSDFLKTGYEKNARAKFMQLYENGLTPLEGYDQLVALFLEAHGASKEDFFRARDALFKNYLSTFKRQHPIAKLPDERWYSSLTTYFRGVDCANPNVDFQGEIILAQKSVADLLEIPAPRRIKIIGNSFTKLKVDGIESLPRVASYAHLRTAALKAQREAKIDFKAEMKKGRALLDAYTCYPVVPMGLLLKLGLVKTVSEIPEFLATYEVTVTGGLNLGKAAWNLTSLNAIIDMREKLLMSKVARYGLVHGNGSLGNQQGITILAAPNFS